MSITSTPHIVVIPYPAQGHVIPLLEFSQCLAEQGFRVTFVNSAYYHRRVLIAVEGKNYIGDKIHLVSIPDGLEPWEDRNDFGNLTQKLLQVMPGKLQELIDQINGREGKSIDCVIADGTMGWAIEVAEKMNIKRAAVWPASAASLALSVNIPKLIDDGIIDSNGTIIKKQMIQLAPDMPELSTANFLWATIGDLRTQKIMFDLLFHGVQAMKAAEYLFCNSTYDLESAPFSLVPELLPIGPLLASNRLGDSAGYFWPEDSHCLKWLDQQKSNSVIYVAFGSIALFDKIQFEELALGLELCNRPFLWVVRQDITKDENDAYPEGFHDRVATRGRMVNWAPQQKVLSHPSIACFLSHCGWNSTVEGVSNGVTFLCWPYFADQFMNESYICDVWNVGLKFNRNESGIITREEIKNKVAQVLGDGNFKARALELKEKTMSSVREGGSSIKAIQNFIEWIKA
ncbi:UDP-glycosyltransferase [Melia azedarach]|uniref:UDP-glycosyltransferase n=1 Tax=Melia azedarach TaxID=155640 RepID=A0ACC1X7P8_MELAZ|nr:UDP-glycosyltransferase [Melia azedarach]